MVWLTTYWDDCGVAMRVHLSVGGVKSYKMCKKGINLLKYIRVLCYYVRTYVLLVSYQHMGFFPLIFCLSVGPGQKVLLPEYLPMNIFKWKNMLGLVFSPFVNLCSLQSEIHVLFAIWSICIYLIRMGVDKFNKLQFFYHLLVRTSDALSKEL